MGVVFILIALCLILNTLIMEVKTVTNDMPHGCNVQIVSEGKQWYRFFRVLFRLTWTARGEKPCGAKVRRIVLAAARMMETVLWQAGENLWECESCNGLIPTDKPKQYKKCPMCGGEITGILINSGLFGEDD
jgi:rubrerythrin